MRGIINRTLIELGSNIAIPCVSNIKTNLFGVDIELHVCGDDYMRNRSWFHNWYNATGTPSKYKKSLILYNNLTYYQFNGCYVVNYSCQESGEFTYNNEMSVTYNIKCDNYVRLDYIHVKKILRTINIDKILMNNE